MELIIHYTDNQNCEPINNVDYFEVLDENNGDGDELYCEFEDGHTETFHNVVIGGGDAE